MSDDKRIDFTSFPEFNPWCEENFLVEREPYEFLSSEVLYKMGCEKYRENTCLKLPGDRGQFASKNALLQRP